MRFRRNEDDAARIPVQCGRSYQAVLHPPVQHDAVGQEVHREHRVETLWCPARPQGGQSRVQHRDIDFDVPLLQFVAKPVHRPKIGEINLEHLHRVGARLSLYLLPRLLVPASASHEDAPAPSREFHGDRLAQTPVRAGDKAHLAVDADASRYRVQRGSCPEGVSNSRDDSFTEIVVTVVPAALLMSAHGAPRIRDDRKKSAARQTRGSSQNPQGYTGVFRNGAANSPL